MRITSQMVFVAAMVLPLTPALAQLDEEPNLDPTPEGELDEAPEDDFEAQREARRRVLEAEIEAGKFPALVAGGRITVPLGPLFEGNAPDVSQTGYRFAGHIREAMKRIEGPVVIRVHWHGREDPQWTVAATQRRAERLATGISSAGPLADRLEAVGVGAAERLNADRTFEDMMANRRVEVISKAAPAVERQTPPPARAGGDRFGMQLRDAVRLARALQVATAPGVKDCAAVGARAMRWARSDGRALAATTEAVWHAADHDLNYRYTKAHRGLMKAYAAAFAAGVAGLQACDEAGRLPDGVGEAFEDIDVVDDLLVEPRGAALDPICRRIAELEAAVRDGPEKVKGEPIEGGYRTTTALPDSTCTLSGHRIMCQVGGAGDAAAASARYSELKSRLTRCHSGRAEDELDRLLHRGGALEQRVWRHTGAPGLAVSTCHLRLVSGDAGARVLVLVERERR